MNESNFWTDRARAMELSVEGNRLIAHELAELAGKLWHRVVHSLDAMIRAHGQHPHLPPV